MSINCHRLLLSKGADSFDSSQQIVLIQARPRFKMVNLGKPSKLEMSRNCGKSPKGGGGISAEI